MSYEAKSVMKRAAVIFGVVVVSAITLIIWNACVHQSTAPIKLTNAETTAPTTTLGLLPTMTNVSQIPKVVPGDTCERAEKTLEPVMNLIRCVLMGEGVGLFSLSMEGWASNIEPAIRVM